MGANASSKATPRRSGLSRERILSAALALADRDGLEGLTMRRLADELGSSPMALYYHVADREALIDGIAELIGLEFTVPDAPGWEAYARDVATRVFTVAHRHPKVAPALLSRPSVGGVPIVGEAVSGLLARLTAAGLTDEEALLAVTTLTGFITGVVLAQIVGRASLPTESPAPETEFAAGLEIVLRGIAVGFPPEPGGDEAEGG